MRLNIVKAKTALLVTGKTQSEIAESVKLSRRWGGVLLSTGNQSARKQLGILPPLWAWT